MFAFGLSLDKLLRLCKICLTTKNESTAGHSDSGDLEIGTLIMGHSLIRSLVRSHRSLVRFLRTARFARALCCAHSFAPELLGQKNIFVQFLSVLSHCA